MENPQLTARQEQAILTRQNIFNATINLINELEFSKVTIRAICKKAGVSVGTFYIYFSSKDDILLEMYRLSDNLLHTYDLNSISPTDAILDIASYTISNTILKFDKAILKEIYRIHLSSKNEYFLSEDRVLFKSIYQIICYCNENNLLLVDLDIKKLTWKIHIFTRGIVFNWLISNSCEDLLKLAIDDLQMYLKLFIKSNE